MPEIILFAHWSYLHMFGITVVECKFCVFLTQFVNGTISLVFIIDYLMKCFQVETLSQSQCNEWRGWVVLLVVVFHWTGYQQVRTKLFYLLPLPNLFFLIILVCIVVLQESLGLIVDRLFEGSMVFLTGYCNYLSQCQKAGRSGARDVVWVRLLQNYSEV